MVGLPSREHQQPQEQPNPQRTADSSRVFWLAALGCSAVAGLVYICTAAPDVTYTDAGELAACCVVWGVAHPTGYPLFTLLGRVWVSFTAAFLTPIAALNLAAALWTAASVVAFFALCWELLALAAPSLPVRQRAWVSSVVALTYAFARTVWEQATAVEVYSLHLLLLWLALWASLRAWRTGSLRWLILAAYSWGLGMTNHGTTILALPAMLWLGLAAWRHRGRFPVWLPLCFALLAATLYTTLPLRSASQPPLDWGGVARGWAKFVYHVTGKQYQVWMFADAETWARNAGEFLALLPWQLGVIGAGLIPVGAWHLWVRHRTVLGWLFLLVLSCLVYALNYSIHDIAAYFLQAFGALILLAGIGVAYLWERYPWLRWALVVVPVVNSFSNWHTNNHRDDTTVLEYLRLIAHIAQSNALIISSQWDYWCSAFWYKQRVEGFRPDIVLVEQELLRRTWYPLQLRRWYPEALSCCPDVLQRYEQELEHFEAGRPYNAALLQRLYEGVFNALIAAHIEQRPVYVTLDVLVREPGIGAAYAKIPEGPLIRLSRVPDTLSARVGTLDLEPLRRNLQRWWGFSPLARELQETLYRSFTASLLYARRIGQTELAERLQVYVQQLRPPVP